MLDKEKEMDEEFSRLLENIKFCLDIVENDSYTVDKETSEIKGSLDYAIEMTKCSARLAEIQKYFDDANQYDPEADK